MGHKTIAIDFDGVIHDYKKGWKDGTIYGKPVKGSRQAIQRLIDHGFDITIYSARCYKSNIKGQKRNHQRKEMEDFLIKHKIPFHKIHCKSGKPWCCLFIDDNAYRFSGTWNDNIAQIISLLLCPTN